MSIVKSITHRGGLHHMLEAVCVPGMAQIKFTLITGKYVLLLHHIPLRLDSRMYFVFQRQFCDSVVSFFCHHIDIVMSHSAVLSKSKNGI